MHKFDFTGLADLTAQLCESKVPVYLTIDLDCQMCIRDRRKGCGVGRGNRHRCRHKRNHVWSG